MERITIALIAHDAKKEDMARLAETHKEKLSWLHLVATKSTGQLVQNRIKLPVTLMQSGPLGGDQQVGSLVTSGMVKAVIFLRDPLTAQPHEPDITALMRVCDVHNVPLATNLASAEALLHFIFEHPELLKDSRLKAQMDNELTVASSEI